MSETPTSTNTPAASWREKGEPDPVGTQYDCERAQLTLGRMTDDELANAVYLHNHRSLDLRAIQARCSPPRKNASAGSRVPS
jgi:hypothetical protein